MRTLWLLIVLLVCPLIGFAQDAQPVIPADASPSVWNQRSYDAGAMMLLLSAEKMPEEFYSYKPSPSLSTFAEILAAVADWQYKNCSAVLGEKIPVPMIAPGKASKSELIAALKTAFAYCGPAYKGMTEAAGEERVMYSSPIGKAAYPKRHVLNLNTGLNSLHYGNVMIYMGLKNILPPSLDPNLTRRAAEDLRNGKKPVQ